MTGITSPPSLTTLHTTGATLLSIAKSFGVEIEVSTNFWRNSHAPSCEISNMPMPCVCSQVIGDFSPVPLACSNAATFSSVVIQPLTDLSSFLKSDESTAARS